MLLQLHEWGDRGAPPIVALHGIGGFGRRFRRLAEEKLGGYRVLAPDLRGHGFSSWDPPWSMSTHVADLLETLDHEGIERAAFVGHSYGGRLILELAATAPGRLERAALLDPAIQILPHVGFDFAERERADGSFVSPQEAIDDRLGHGDPDAALVRRGGRSRAPRARRQGPLPVPLLQKRRRDGLRGALLGSSTARDAPGPDAARLRPGLQTRAGRAARRLLRPRSATYSESWSSPVGTTSSGTPTRRRRPCCSTSCARGSGRRALTRRARRRAWPCRSHGRGSGSPRRCRTTTRGPTRR